VYQIYDKMVPNFYAFSYNINEATTVYA